MSATSFGVAKLGDHFGSNSGGTPDRSVPEYWNGPISWISPKDFKGPVTSSSEERITQQAVKDKKLSVFDPGTVLIVVRSGVLRHTLPVTQLAVPAAINQDVKALIPKTNDFLPSFLAAYLEVKQHDVLAFSVKHSTTVQSINTEEFVELQIPKPPKPTQSRLVTELKAARDRMLTKVAQADAYLAGLDGFVLDALGLALPSPEGNSTTYAVRTRDVRTANKLHPDYFHPERINAIRAVESRYTGDRGKTLLDIADFIRDVRIPKPEDAYLGLANVRPNTGERIESSEEDGKGNCFRFAAGDVLFARLRPYLNKVYTAESDGVCSTEFHVIRVRRNDKGQPLLVPDYLAALIRSSLLLAQTRHMMTGNTHPRLAYEDVVNLVVPIPGAKVQEAIAAEVVRRREEARQLRDEGRKIWYQAKRRFEEELLGPGVASGISNPQKLMEEGFNNE